MISNGVPSAVVPVPVAAVGQAVPVLARPFPLPPAAMSSTIRTSQCPKDPETGKLGIFFSWNGLGGAVSIKELTGPASSSCSLRVGQWVLTINGVPVQNSKHAARLVRDTPGPTVVLTTCEAPTTTTTTQRNNKHLPPFTKLVAAPLWPHTHPGVVLDSTRDRTLVQVSRVFAKGPFGGTHSGLRPGDLVLAVNGTAVSNVQQADAALLQQQQPYTVLYVVDMTAYRHSVWEELKHSPLLAGWSSSDEQQMQWLDQQDDNSPITNKFKSPPTRVQVTFRKKLVVDLEFDFATQHLAEPSSIRSGSKTKNKLCSKRLRRKLVLPFLEAFNERIDKRMHGLEEAVANEAWKHMSSSSSSLSPTPLMPTTVTTTQDSRCSCGVTSSSSSLSLSTEEPTASEDESSVTAPETSSSSTSSSRRKPTMSDYGDNDEDDAATIPLAAAEIEVLPVSALQTLAERNNCCSNSMVVQAT